MAQEDLGAAAGRGEKLVLARRPRVADRRMNAPARFEYFHVGRAAEAHLVFSRARAAVYQVGVAIHEAGRDEAAAAIERLAIGAGAFLQVRARPNGGDDAVAREDGVASSQSFFGQRGAAARAARGGEYLARVVHE
ncbi:MAG: hypothetical protein GTN49_03255 [candidate division Zixibacteria bacterium]|nr:hypothetical protein [candidate division Zixibacteria bacterium]